jgi:carboxyl-terminal processing protease
MSNRNPKYTIYLPIAFSLVLIAGIWLGFALSKNDQSAAGNFFPLQKNAYHKVDDILDYIVRDYVDSVDVTELETNAIDGMLNDLDPHSQYISAKEFHMVNDPLMGSFEGIGISFRIEKDTIMVINTIGGGPSEKVGLMAGDRIVKIEDSLVIGISNTNAVRKLKGEKGTEVKVSVYRRGIPKLLDFNITRDVIPTYSLDVAYMVNDSIGYIKLNKFSATSYREFSDAVNDLNKHGMKKLIFDLRGNAGGLLTDAINIADAFLPKGKLIVYTEGKNRPKKYAYATDKGELIDEEVVILIDEGSASASEIVAGAIQDNDRGTIIGRRSFGKGLVQEQMVLPDGSAIRLTVARYYTPTGRCIQKPYQKEDFKEYNSEYYHRFMDGELFNKDSIKFADSLKYETPGGKIVYGGGGIMPDIFIPIITDSIHSYYNSLANKGLIFQFAFDYTDRNRTELTSYKDFMDFDRRFNISNKVFSELVAYAKENGVKASREEVNISKDKIKILFKAFVARNIFDEKGFYPIYHQVDTTFKRAVYELEYY